MRPAGARWNKARQEWTLENGGVLVSAWKYYANGDLARETHYSDGVIASRRLVRPTTDLLPIPPLERLDSNIATCLMTYERGDLIGMQFYDAAGREISEHGQRMKKRPKGVPETAWFLDDTWHWSRRHGEDGDETIESREYFASGKLREISDYRTGSQISYYANGTIREQGQRRRDGDRYPKTGTWRQFDPKGQLRCVSQFDRDGDERVRTWHRTAREAKAGGTSREGRVDRGMEVGLWVVRDGTGNAIAEWDLGPYTNDEELLAHAATGDELDDAYQPAANDRSPAAILARIRRAGRSQLADELGLDPTPAWRMLDPAGKQVPLTGWGLVGVLHALSWGPPDAARLADLAARLFGHDRAAAALDAIDAAQRISDEPSWRIHRASYLRKLGRLEEAERLLAGPDRLEPRALELLAEVRANPDDDAPRLVFADQIATAFPEHAELIVAQCGKRGTDAVLRAFLGTLPKWIRDYPLRQIVRGFYDDLRYVEAATFVTSDPDLLFRIAPTCNQLDLRNASGEIATLVTMPALRRYRELSFSDTYLFDSQVEQLAACPYLEQLEDLGLYATGLDDDRLRTLFGSTAFPRLQTLDLGAGRGDMDYTLDGLGALPDAVFAPTLRGLFVAGRWLGNEVVDIVARLPALTALDLSSGDLSDDGAHALVALPHAFASLVLANNEFTPGARKALLDRFGERVQFRT